MCPKCTLASLNFIENPTYHESGEPSGIRKSMVIITCSVMVKKAVQKVLNELKLFFFFNIYLVISISTTKKEIVFNFLHLKSHCFYSHLNYLNCSTTQKVKIQNLNLYTSIYTAYMYPKTG